MKSRRGAACSCFRALSLIALGVAALSGALAMPSFGEPILVKVHAGSREALNVLRSIGAELYLKADGYAVVKLDDGDLPALGSSGLKWKPLSTSNAGPLYYLVPGGGSSPFPLRDLWVVDGGSEGTIVEAGPEAIAAARDAGYLTIPLDRAWPIMQLGFLDLEFVHDSVLRDESFYTMTRKISRDTLTSYVQHLQDYGTRHSESIQIARAGKWLADTLGRFGYPDTLFESLEGEKGVFAGVAGNVTGSKPGLRRPDFRILVGGHYDSITNNEMVPPQEEAPGADDNASGTAAALEIARVLADYPLDATVEYVLFSGEEQGLQGSRRFATQLVRESVPIDRLFFINMDMIGNSEHYPWRVKIFTDQASQPLADLTARVAEAYTEVLPVMEGNSGASDHASLQQVGYPAIMLHENDFSTVYHSRNDLLVELEMDYMAEVVRIVAATVLHLSTIAEPPTGVIASETESGEFKVEWVHSPDADVVGYHVEVLDRAGRVVDEIFTRENEAVLSLELVASGQRVRVRSEDVLGEGDPSEDVFFGDGSTMASVAGPNPTASGVRFSLFIPGSGPPVDTTVRILDAAGRLVRTIPYGALSRGSQVLEWDGYSSSGELGPSGVYFYMIEAGGVGVDGGKLIVLR